MNWYIKAFSQLTKVSVRTLHHYDDLGLLKPSLRSPNGYRVYSQDDLLKLERIVALKFFGFSLQQIRVLVRNDGNIMDHLKAQQNCLEEQIQHLHRASQTISELTAESTAGKSIDWSKIATLLEVYRMTKDLKKTWAGKVYSEDQLAQFAQLRQRYTEEEMKAYNDRWTKLIDKVKANLDKDPAGPVGQKLIKEWFSLLNEVYGDYPELKDAISLAYKYNKIPGAPCDQKLWDFVHKGAVFMTAQKNKKQ